MSAEMQNNIEQTQEQKPSDKEINFAKVRKQLEEERYARQMAEQKAAEIEKIYQEKMAQRQLDGEEDHDDEPYVDHKKLERKFAKFERNLEQKIDHKATEKASQMMEEFKKQQWLKANPDFGQVMDHAQTFAERDPELAETILQMPDNFERQKLVYKNIKALGLHKKEEPKETVQDKVDANRRNYYYIPSSAGTPPYASQSDFSPVGQKSAYQKMQELKNKLRI